MLTSLFGDLGSLRNFDPKRRAASDLPDGGFAATAIMESVATEVNARGQIIDRHSHDLVVNGSPAQAIREHFAATRSDLDTATSLITLLDPAGIWASAVIKALSDAGGRPIERLHLRESATLRTLATIERTTLVRRNDDTLRIYHADVRAPGSDNAEVPVALMERSHLAAVIVGALQPHAVDALLQALLAAVMLPTWRCPQLLFLLPPGAAWVANKISAMAWPARLQVHVVSESMTGASSVWNSMLAVWNQVKGRPGWDPAAIPPLMGMNDFPIKVSELDQAAHSAGAVQASAALVTRRALAAVAPRPAAVEPLPPVVRVNRHALDPARAERALAGMSALEGLIGCAVVDSGTGLVLASRTRGEAPLDMGLAAAACAQVLRTHRRAAHSMGQPEQVDEVMTTAGPRQQVMRTLSQHPELFLVVLLDKLHSNLALARYQLMEVERGLH